MLLNVKFGKIRSVHRRLRCWAPPWPSPAATHGSTSISGKRRSNRYFCCVPSGKKRILKERGGGDDRNAQYIPLSYFLINCLTFLDNTSFLEKKKDFRLKMLRFSSFLLPALAPYKFLKYSSRSCACRHG